MESFFEGDIFNGNSYANMINNALDIKCEENYRRSGVDLPNDNNIIAWFGYLNGEVHGYYQDKYYWRNIIKIENGEEYIYEEYLGETEFIINKMANSRLCPYRVVFGRDPFESGNAYICRFMGVYCLDAFWGKDNMNKRFKKVSDRYFLFDKDPKKVIYEKMPVLCEAVKELGLSEETLNIIKNNGVMRIGEVLELEFGGNVMSKELLKSLQRFFALSAVPELPKSQNEPPVVIPNNPEDYIGAVVKNNKYGVGWIKGIKGGYFIVVFKGKEHKYTLSSINNGLTVIQEENDNDDNISVNKKSKE